jgi:eukaryotic-like serine/threonine-protein kinase
METIGGRFEVESVAGEGGMGTVYRARDLASAGATVALKIVRGEFANARFEREAMLLAQIEGAGIVRYVAHGRADADSMFLAMEWLEGVSLDTRLRRGALTIGECLILGRRLARALGVAHARGVIHRDVKPSNIILRDGRAAEATLVDFGIARANGAARAMTATGAVIGTPQYMSPEQARGERTVDARADVFSLGCVLFECLAGRCAFVGEHVVAVLAKILLEPAGRVSALRSEVPALLDDLVAAMLEKSPGARPASGAAVALALDVIHASDAPVAATPSAPGIGATERRLATVIIARAGNDVPADADEDSADALSGVTHEMQIIEVAAGLGVSVAALANGALVGAVVAEAGASSAAERAVRCALALRADLENATIALATGRAVVAGHLPVGEAIDAAAMLFEKHTGRGGIWIDEATASMLDGRADGRFLLDRGGADSSGLSVIGERPATERVRTVMGRETPCVGRARELALFEITFRECFDEPIARAVIVIAPPGIGKTRLRRELGARVATWDPAPVEWLGLADPGMHGASYALARDLLRRVLELPESGSIERKREALIERVAKTSSADARNRSFIAHFLG